MMKGVFFLLFFVFISHVSSTRYSHCNSTQLSNWAIRNGVKMDHVMFRKHHKYTGFGTFVSPYFFSPFTLFFFCFFFERLMMKKKKKKKIRQGKVESGQGFMCVSPDFHINIDTIKKYVILSIFFFLSLKIYTDFFCVKVEPFEKIKS